METKTQRTSENSSEVLVFCIWRKILPLVLFSKRNQQILVVHHSACQLVHKVDVLQDFYLIHVVYIFKAS